MKKCPDHINKYAVSLSYKNKYIEYECDEYHVPYLIQCDCGSEIFNVFLNEMPTAKAICIQCNKEITLYDLHHYPASSIIKCNEKFKLFTSTDGNSNFKLAIMYEYSEEEEDVEFDPNDITWCDIYGYVEESGQGYKILSDETA